MGSYDYDTQRTNSAGVGHKNSHAATEVAETEEVKHLKSQYKNDLTTLQELFTDWSEADLLFALQENQGDLEITITRISEGHIAQWGEVKSRKSKKEHSSKNKQSGQQFGNAQRGQRGGYSDRGRARGEGGRGGRNNDRSRGPRRENGSGYNRPPRQQNGSNHDDASNVIHGKAWGTDNTNSSRNNNNDSIEGNLSNNNNTNEGTSTWATENVTGDWSTDITTQGGSWSTENPAENAKSSWTNDSTDKAQSSRSKENSTDNSQPGWSVDNTTEDSTDNITASRDIDKATDNLKHNRDSNITKDNWDTEHSKDNWGVENDSWAADTPKDNWSSDNLGVDTTKSNKIVKEVSKSPNTIMRSVAPTKSPVSHSLRTIPSKPKASWAQIVKPESKPEPKPEPIPTSVHKGPETVKPVSPQISKAPNPIQSPPAPKVAESVIIPPQETLTTTIKTEEMKEYVREVASPEVPTATSVTTSTPVVNVSPLAKEVSPPGLHKTKTGTATRRLKQDAPVVMPNTGAGLERVGVQFGSLSISNNVEESSETETQVVPQVQKTEERSPVSVETSPQPQTTPIQQQQQIAPQQTVQQLQQQVSQQVVQQQATQQLQQQAAQLQQLQQQPPQSAQPQSSTLSQSSNSINRLPTTSAQALPSSVGSAPTGTPANAPNPTIQNFNPSYFKQQQDQSSAAYLNQQHHLGLATEPLNAPYASYLPNQPPNQLSGFGIGPIQSIPEYNAMYGPDAQRIMGYYDPAYGQASPVTSTGYQGRDNKYTSDTATNTNSQTTNQQSTGTQQSTNQQGGQNPQQQAYPLAGVPYYPYYYMTNQYPSAYQQSGYGQPFVNKSIYPMYNHPHSTKPGSASGASPYGYPTTPTTPNTPHHYSHTSNTGYDEVTAAQMHHHPGVPSVLDYQKPYSIPPLNFLGNAGGNNPQPTGTANSSSTGGKSGNNGSTELNPPTQYKTYQEKTSANTQSSVGVGQTGSQQHQQPTNPNYYGQQQAQQMFNNYQHPQTHHQYYPHQAHHQATNRNQQQFWTSQS